MNDIQLIASNCEQYNGPESELTKDARILVEFTKGALDEVRFYNNNKNPKKNVKTIWKIVFFLIVC